MSQLTQIIAASRRRGGFNPFTLSPALWLDATDATTLYNATTGGSLVAADGEILRWEDKSGNARHATQGGAGLRPIRKTAIVNGLDVARFDGSNDYMSTVAFSGNETWWRTVVFKSLNDAQYDVVIGWGENYDTPRPGADYIAVNAAKIEVSQNGAITTSKLSQKVSTTAVVAISTGFNIVTQICNGTNAGHSVRVNGAVQATTNLFANDPGTFSKVSTSYGIGAFRLGASPGNCEIAEILHIPGSATGVTDLEAHLANKYGIAI
jgi:hypothetical protein